MAKQTISAGMTGAEFILALNNNTDELYDKGSSIGLNVKDYGAIGDGIIDDTIIIQNTIDLVPIGGTLFIPQGVYMIKATGDNAQGTDGGLKIEKSMTIVFEKNAELKAIPGNKSGSNIIWIEATSYVEIYGGKLTGDFDLHVGNGEVGYCVFIRNSSNIYLHDLYFSQASGDNIACYRTIGEESKNITIERCYFTDNRRWGIFCDTDDNVIIKYCHFKDIDGDVEYGGAINFENHDIPSPIRNVTINNCIFDNIANNGGVTMQGHDNYINNVHIYDNDFIDCPRCINIRDNFQNVVIDGNEINDCSLIGIDINGGEGGNMLGSSGIIIINNFCKNTVQEANAILFGDSDDAENSLINGGVISNNFIENFASGICTNIGQTNFLNISDNKFTECIVNLDLSEDYGMGHIYKNNMTYNKSTLAYSIIDPV